MMRRRTAGAPVAVPGAILIPIEESWAEALPGPAGLCLYACKRPVAVVVCRAGETLALDMDGGRTGLDELLNHTPGLLDAVAACAGDRNGRR